MPRDAPLAIGVGGADAICRLGRASPQLKSEVGLLWINELETSLREKLMIRIYL
jgi:hypothetical protein